MYHCQLQKTQTLLAVLSWKKDNWGIEYKTVGRAGGAVSRNAFQDMTAEWSQGNFCLCSPHKGREIKKPPLECIHHGSRSPGTHRHCCCHCPSSTSRVDRTLERWIWLLLPLQLLLSFRESSIWTQERCGRAENSKPLPPIFLHSHRQKQQKEGLYLLAVFHIVT